MAVEIEEKTLDGEHVNAAVGQAEQSAGSVGLDSQLPGQGTTVSGVANATGGIRDGGLLEVDIDEDLYLFRSDDTPLMQLMLKAKSVTKTSPVIEHYMLDEPKALVTTNAALEATTNDVAVLPLDADEAQIPRDFTTLLCKGVDGYDKTGQKITVGRNLMLIVTGRDSSGNPIVRAVNGPKKNDTDELCTIPAIPAGTECVILSTACYETQMYVDPDIETPLPRIMYLQKRIMNRVISDYFASQRKKAFYQDALLAERAIANFKKRCNRSLWVGIPGMFNTYVPGVGLQTVYMSEGIRWQFTRELMKQGTWTYEEFIALAKMFYTGEDVPKNAICLCGKNFLEKIQTIDWSKHPEVRIEVTTNDLGWRITRIHTVFGSFDFKREPTLDTLGFSNSAAIIAEGRLVHYSRTPEHSFDDKIIGQEAKRTGIIRWDCLALKGISHIWINGEDQSTAVDDDNTIPGATKFELVFCSDISEIEGSLVDGTVYYFMEDCKLNDTTTAASGTMWKYKGGEWSLYTGDVLAKNA